MCLWLPFMEYVLQTMKENDDSKRRAFTLVEMLIVVVVLAILATIALPLFANSSRRAKENSLRSNLRILRDAIDRYKKRHGSFPPGIG